ncbi:MAG TPA: PAS domain-containing protein [Pseudonocardiaceae bacterium]|jgi:PAS domain S-box-containing protein|nr:PAS domain-containing protein [Pseudonocardiaceae bacterium]
MAMARGGGEQPHEFPGDPASPVANLVPFRSPSSVMTSVWDFDGYTVSINPIYQAVLGWSVEELSSVPYWELLHHDDQDRSVEARQRMLLSGPGRLRGHRIRMLRRDGTYRCIRWDIRSNAEEQCTYLVGVDISGHEPIVTGKRVLVGSWDWHIPTNTVTWSEGMFTIYGLAPGSVRNLDTALRRVYINDQAAVERAIQRSLANQEPYVADHRIADPDGGIRWLHSAGRVFFGENRDPERMRGFTWDVTGRQTKRVPG